MDTDETIERAVALCGQGRLGEAEVLYRDLLRVRPETLAALEGLGIIVFQQGKVDEAASLFARGLAIRPDSPRFHAYLGEALRLLKRNDQALHHLRRGVTLDPKMPLAWNSLGLLAYEQGRFAAAEVAYRQAIRLQPTSSVVYNNLGNALQARRQWSEAAEALRTALRLDPDNAVALTNLGQVLCEMGDPAMRVEAESICRRAVAVAPRLPQASENLGNLLRLQGRFDEAMACYESAWKQDPRRSIPLLLMGRLHQQRGDFDGAARSYEDALRLEPTSPRCHVNYASLWADRGNFEQAARYYRAALGFAPGDVVAHHGLGLALLEQGRLDEAEACFREALRIDPSLAATWAGLARLQAERGDFDQSCQSARSALAIEPGFPDAYCRLATNLRGRLPQSELQVMEGLLDLKALSDDTRASLHFCLAAVFDARGLHSRAAALVETANVLRASGRAARGQSYRPDTHSRLIDGMIATFTPDFLARRRGWGEPDPRPVFVVGLPRSGTTLVEQVLASHSQVYGAGELAEARRTFRSLPELVGQPSLEPFEALNALGPVAARAASRRYLDQLHGSVRHTAARVVDKMPDNLELLGLIALLWPGARVIVCGRDLRDIAVSCRQTDFVSIDWTNDWEHLARRFADHQRILEHWKRTRPLEWLDVRYEDLVVDLEAQARRLVAYLGLDWEPACLEFHTTRRVVRTASMQQVRQPIHRHSVGRFRNYESMLVPLLQALERHGVQDFGPG
jgi:tetratricopeptide (TPR) repeat protein